MSAPAAGRPASAAETAGAGHGAAVADARPPALARPRRSPQALLRRLEWRVRRLTDSFQGGELRSALRGRGREFDQVVRYEWGDDVRDIDWNVTARLGEPYRKQFVEERELTLVWLFEDCGSLRAGSGPRTRREVLAEAMLLLGLLAAQQQDRVGVWHARPEGARWCRPLRGRRALSRVAGELGVAPEERLGDAAIDWRTFARLLPRGSVVVWLSDFPPRPIPEAWARLRRRHEVVGIRVDDPWDQALPDIGAVTALDPSGGRLVPLDPRSPSVRRRHAAWREAREAGFRELFPDPLSRCVLHAERDTVDEVVAFLRARMRAIRA